MMKSLVGSLGLVRSEGARSAGLFAFIACALACLGCEDVGKKSAQATLTDLPVLVQAAENDVAQVRSGLPVGVKHIENLFAAAAPEVPAFDAARDALLKAREKTQDLRVAKSTFFAIALPDGKVLRNDQKQDLMAGKSIFPAFAAIQPALAQGYLEGRGKLPEANGVKGDDGQWVAAMPVKRGADAVGYYITGWSWSAYAYRLQLALRSTILSRTKAGGKVPLTYVYVLVEGQAYGAPTAPLVTAKVLSEGHFGDKLKGAPSYSEAREIEGRMFGIGVAPASALGKDVLLAIVRSET
jgi:hypothetical protein